MSGVVRHDNLTPPQREIPKYLHLIWMQGAESLAEKRPEFPQYEKRWREMLGPEWSLKVWDMESLHRIVREVTPASLRHLENPDTPIAAKSDIGRFAIMYKYGGVYVDVGTRPIRSILYLLRDTQFAFIYRDVSDFEHKVIGNVNTSWFAAVPRHPIVASMITVMEEAPMVGDRQGQTVAQWVNTSTGPAAWWQSIEPHVQEDGVRAVPFAVVDPITMSNVTVNPEEEDSVVRERFPAAALVHNGRESWISKTERAGLTTAKFARDNWGPIVIVCLVLLILGFIVGGILIWLVIRYKRCCFKGSKCVGGKCPV